MKILLVADEPGWVFERHCKEIQKRLIEHKIDIAYRKDRIVDMQRQYDLIYVLDPIPLKHGYPDSKKTIMGLRCEFLHNEHPHGPKGLYESGFPGRCVSIKDKCSAFHVVNRNMYELYKQFVIDKPLFLAQHGVDETIFDGKKYPQEARDELIIGMAGRLAPNKGGDILQAACNETGVHFVTAQYHQKLTKEQMPIFYRRMDVYVCLSKSEGLHNPTMEAGAMGIPVITTRCGAAEEIIEDGVNGFLIDRNVESLVGAINKFKSNRDLVKFMGNQLYNTVMNNWTWEKRIEDFRTMFKIYIG